MSGMAALLRHALEHIAALGAGGYAVFILLYAAACVAFLPVSALTFGAGALFGVGRAFALVWTGASLGSCAAFLIGRHWLRGWVEKRLARHPVFAAIDAAVSAEGWRVVVLTRLTPLFPFALQNYAYGLTRVTFPEYALASLAGMAPGTLLYVWVGAAAGDAVRAGTGGRARTPAEWAFFAVGLLAAAVVVTLIGREARAALARHVKPAP